MKRIWPLVTLLLLPLASAQLAVGVNPPGLILQGQPGATLTATIRLDNPQSQPIQVRVSLGDWNYNDRGQITFYPPNTLPGSAASWITVNPLTLTLAGKGHAFVRYSVHIPPGTPQGTHWAVLFFEGKGTTPPPGHLLASFRVRVGYILYINVGKTTVAGKIAGILGAYLGLDRYQFAIEYANTGTQAVSLNGRVEVRNAQGLTVVTIPIRGVVSLPGAIRLFKATLLGPLPAGEYSALVILNNGTPGQDLAGQYTFTLNQPLPAPPPPPKGTP